MRIEELIPSINIENKNVEFKRYIEEGKDEDGKIKEIGWLKTIAAFANTEGGSLFIGVDNKTHSIISLDHNSADKIILMIHRLIKQKIEPQIEYSIKYFPISEKKETRYVLCVVVEKNKDLPVTLHEQGMLGIYIRSYGNTILATPSQIRELVLLSDSVPFDTDKTDIKYKCDDFSSLLNTYKEKNGKDLTEKALFSLGFIDEKHNLKKGALLFRDNYCDAKTKISCTLWPETTKGSDIVLASSSFSLPLLESINEAVNFIKNHSASGFVKTPNSRNDYVAYPKRSVFEGVVNAIAHRNYFIQGSQIEINIFKDRLEITSPGSLLGCSRLIKEKNISSIIPKRRNELICRMLESLKLMESKGSGFDKIEEDYYGYSDAFKPYISADSNSFTLVLPDLTNIYGVYDEDSIPDIYISEIGNDSKNDYKILSYCYFKPHSAPEIASYLGIEPSSYFRKQVLENLINKKLLTIDKSQRPSKYFSNRKNVHIK